DRVRRYAECERGSDLHLVEQAIAQGLFVNRNVVAAPHRTEEQIGLRRQRLGDVRREVGRAERRPALRYDLRAGQQPLEREREVFGSIATVTVVRMDVRDLANVRPSLRRTD